MKLNICLRFLFCVTFFMYSINAVAPDPVNQEAQPNNVNGMVQPEEVSRKPSPNDDHDFTFGIDTELKIQADHTLEYCVINYYPLLKFFKFYFTYSDLLVNMLSAYENLTPEEKKEQIPFLKKLFELMTAFEKQVMHNEYKFTSVKLGSFNIIENNDDQFKILGKDLLKEREKILKAWILISNQAGVATNSTSRALIHIYRDVFTLLARNFQPQNLAVLFKSRIQNLFAPLEPGQTMDVFVENIKNQFDADIEEKHLFNVFYKAAELIENFERSLEELVDISAYKKKLTQEEQERVDKLISKIIDSYQYLSNVQYNGRSNFMDEQDDENEDFDSEKLFLKYGADGYKSVPYSMRERPRSDILVINFYKKLFNAVANIVQLDKPPEISEDNQAKVPIANQVEVPKLPGTSSRSDLVGKQSEESPKSQDPSPNPQEQKNEFDEESSEEHAKKSLKPPELALEDLKLPPSNEDIQTKKLDDYKKGKLAATKKMLDQFTDSFTRGINNLMNGSNDKTMLILTLFIPIQLVTMLLILS